MSRAGSAQNRSVPQSCVADRDAVAPVVSPNDWLAPSLLSSGNEDAHQDNVGSKSTTSGSNESKCFSHNLRTGAIRCRACKVVVAEGGTPAEWSANAVERHIISDPAHAPLVERYLMSVKERLEKKQAAKHDVTNFLKGTGYAIINGKFICTVCSGRVGGPSKSVQLALCAMEKHEREAEHRAAFEQFERSRRLAPAAAAIKPLLSQEERERKAEAYLRAEAPRGSLVAHSTPPTASSFPLQTVPTAPLPPPGAKIKIMPRAILRNPNRIAATTDAQVSSPPDASHEGA